MTAQIIPFFSIQNFATKNGAVDLGRRFHALSFDHSESAGTAVENEGWGGVSNSPPTTDHGLTDADLRDIGTALRDRPAPRPLSRRQWMEHCLLQRAAVARDPDARRILMNQADRVALTIRTSPVYLPPLPEEDDGSEITVAEPWPLIDRRPTVAALSLGIIALAALIALMPPFWG